MSETRVFLSDEEREQVVRCYLATGSYSKAEAMTGVPKSTIAVWKHRDPQWWEDTVAKINAEMEESYRAGWRGVLAKSLDVMQDRLENGNHQLIQIKTEKGVDTRLERVPVPAKDAVVIAGIAADKLRVSMGLPNRITGKVEDNDRLEQLRKLAEASRAARKEAQDESAGKTIN